MAVSTQPNQAKRVPRILGALVLAGVLIFGAYALSTPSLFAPQTANAQSTQALLAAFAQQKGPNGLPLWEDQLLATSSTSPLFAATAGISGSSTPDVTDGTSTPDTVTDQFAQNLFSQYMSQYGGSQPSDTDIDSFAQSAMQTMAENQEQQNAYSQSDVRVSGEGPAALTTYAGAFEAAITPNAVNLSESELDYFSDAVEKGDTNELKYVAMIGNSYTADAPAIMKIAVPKEAQYAQLEIANAFARLGVDIADMSAMQTDPLRAYLGLSAYQADATSLTQGFADMSAVFSSEQVTLTPGQPGYYVYNAARKASSNMSASASSTSSSE